MIQQHWKNHNTFEHYGTGDFHMLGWDPLVESETVPLFNFDEIDRQQLHEQLLDSLPNKIYSLVCEHPVTIDRIIYAIGNQTTAQNSDLKKVIATLAEEKEFDILDNEGRPRSRSLKLLNPTDQVALPKTPLIPAFSRRSK